MSDRTKWAEASEDNETALTKEVGYALLDGSTNIDIRVLSLKLLLTKLREQMRVITDAEVRVLKAYELQRYFLRYEQMLGHELGQLGR